MTAPAPTALYEHIVLAAMLAPSIHNTQPWQFSPYDGGLDLWAEPGRQLPVLDPDGRQLHVSCGAALHLAQVAARALGLDPVAELLPDAGDPSHLARLALTVSGAPTSEQQDLAAAIGRRHTYRGVLDDRRVPPELLDRLRLAAEQQGARLRLIAGTADLLELEVALSRADRVEQADAAYRGELADWVRAGPLSATPERDGIPAEALPVDAQHGSSLRLRDFQPDAERDPGSSTEPPPAEHPDVVVLVTDDDTAQSWLRAGQALGAVLLTAAGSGVSAQPLGQATDLPGSRQRLRAALGLLGTPQLALRLGYAPAGAPTPATPRRVLHDVLTGPRTSRRPEETS